jgi:TonB family protein
MKKDESILSRIEIAKPCSANWESMTGDERQRACQLCHLNVYNISTMTDHEAESFLRERLPQGRVCVRLFRRVDGTIITDNCPRGLRAARDAARHVKHQVAVVASSLLAFILPLPAQPQNSGETKMMGKVRAIPMQPQDHLPTAGMPSVKGEVRVAPAGIMGSVCPSTDMVSYVAKMQKKIRIVWQLPANSNTKIKVLFKIKSNGSICDLRIGSSSGEAQLDKKAIEAVKKAAPFDKLPPLSQATFETEYTF